MKDPAALFYIDTWLSSTAEMDADCRGWYLNLILHQYDKGSLPSDIEKLGQMAGVKFSEFERFKQVFEQVLKQKFEQNDEGRLENPKVSEMLQKRNQFKDKRSRSGKIGYIVKTANKLKSYGDKEIEYLKDYCYNLEEEELNKLNDKQKLRHLLKHLLKLYKNGDGNENGDVIRDKEKGKSFLSKEELGQFKEVWEDYLEHKSEMKKSYKSAKSERIGFKQLLKMSDNDVSTAWEIVEQSRANQWQGLFPLKKEKGSGKKKSREQLEQEAMEQELKRIDNQNN